MKYHEHVKQRVKGLFGNAFKLVTQNVSISVFQE